MNRENKIRVLKAQILLRKRQLRELGVSIH